MTERGFRRFAVANLLYNLGVIAWGAYVRATGSGAGCGAHWPLCNGVVVPRDPTVTTLIEYSHRLTSGLALIGVVLLVFFARRIYAKGEPTRFGAHLSLGLMLVEALLGAGLVLLGLVEDNDSVARAVAMVLHLVNTLLLVGALTLTIFWASGGGKLRLRDQGALGAMSLLGIAAMLLLGASGAIAALGDTLFPATTLREGFAQDISSTAHFLLRLRVLHPILAMGTGAWLLVVAGVAAALRPVRGVRVAGLVLIGLFVIQLAAGLVNLVLLAPIWLQLVHLLLADLVWIALVWLSASTLSAPIPRHVATEEEEAPALSA